MEKKRKRRTDKDHEKNMEIHFKHLEKGGTEINCPCDVCITKRR